MESFWKWLRGANAQTVFVASLLALLAVTAWWVWKEYAPSTDEERHVSSGKSSEKEPEPLGIISTLDREASWSGAIPARDPFQSPFPPLRQTQTVATVVSPKPPPPEPKPEPPPPKVVVQPPPVTPPPMPRERITLTYKGRLRMNDGQTMILLQDSKSNKSSFYTLNKPLFGMGVGRVSEREVELVLSSGSSVTLAFGKPTTIELE